jgi:hypothetical protein
MQRILSIDSGIGPSLSTAAIGCPRFILRSKLRFIQRKMLFGLDYRARIVLP